MGKQIAFTGQLEGPPAKGESGWNLYMIDGEHASPHQLTFGLLIPRFTWSPDGQFLAFVAWSMLGGRRVETLYLLGPGNSKLHRLTEGKGSILWNWSPDGKQIAFTCFEENLTVTWPSPHGELFIMNLERDEIRQRTRETAYVVWSHETNDIAFFWKHDNHNIAVMDADSTNRRLLFHSRLLVSPYSWSPNGKFLACNVASRSHWGAEYKDFDQLHVFDVNGNLVWQKEWRVDLLAWSPDSQRIACVAPSEIEDNDKQPCVYVMKRDGSAFRPLGLTNDETEVAWSPNSQRVAFIGYDIDKGEYTLGVHDVDGQNLRSYPMEGEDLVGDLHPHAPTWSPDSQQIAYNGPGHHHLHVVKISETFPYLFTNNVWQPFNKENQEYRNERAAYNNLILGPAWQP
jgi:Tol biopolymer transport system component